jgi:sortase (surface protein transpeptidase)
MTARAAWCAGLVVGLSLITAALIFASVTRYQAPTDAGTLPPGAGTAATAASAQPDPQGRPRVPGRTMSPAAAAGPVPAVPTRLYIPVLGVRAPIVAVRASGDGSLAVPGDPGDVGWWIGSATPQDPHGTVVLDGHVDTASSGAGALFRLAGLPLGAQVVVATSAGDIRYRVAARRVYAKAGLPPQIFDTSGPPRLTLVTCGGPFDTQTHHYADNVVVFATPLPRKEP